MSITVCDVWSVDLRFCISTLSSSINCCVPAFSQVFERLGNLKKTFKDLANS